MANYQDVDEYMAQLPDDRRAVMEQLRSTIRAASPTATEVISYNMPAFRLNGRFLVSYEAFKRHYSIFPWSDEMLEELGDPLRPHAVGNDPVKSTSLGGWYCLPAFANMSLHVSSVDASTRDTNTGVSGG